MTKDEAIAQFRAEQAQREAEREARRRYDYQVGDGATLSVGSDRYAYTVVKRTAKTMTLQADRATMVRGGAYSESQDYTYEPNPNGSLETARLVTRGWMVGGYMPVFPGRNARRDPSF